MSRNGAVQMFFLTPNRNMFPEKFVKCEKNFGSVSGAYHVKYVEVHKMSEVF